MNKILLAVALLISPLTAIECRVTVKPLPAGDLSFEISNTGGVPLVLADPGRGDFVLWVKDRDSDKLTPRVVRIDPVAPYWKQLIYLVHQRETPDDYSAWKFQVSKDRHGLKDGQVPVALELWIADEAELKNGVIKALQSRKITISEK